VELRCSTQVTDLDRGRHEIVLGRGEQLGYDKLLLTTGAIPRTLTVPGADQVDARCCVPDRRRTLDHASISSWVFTPEIRRTDPQPKRAHTTSSPAPASEPSVSRTRSPLVSSLSSDSWVSNHASDRHS
jgi:hypothetical protein